MSIASIFGLKGRAETREGTRTRILLSAALLVEGRPARIHLLDLSRKGALGHSSDPPSSGQIVWLVCQGAEILARTAWVRGSRFGLAFDASLPAAKLEQMVRAGRHGLEAQSDTSSFD